MVNTGLEYGRNIGGLDMQGVADAMRILGITKMTLYKWILQKKIGVKRIKIGSRTLIGVPESEIERVKALMVKKRPPGKSWLKKGEGL